ncbi:corazonin receptor [Halictus rubicundus]|uniref:corazonin receptor n=1 Tax=Halictus rubicundus TaxID=77578 RepID=UPI0040366BDD
MMTMSTELVGNFSVNVLPACDNLTNFLDYSRGLGLGLDSQIWQNFSEHDYSHRYDSPNNTTCLEHAPQLTNRTLFKVVVLSIMAIISFMANLATIYSIAKSRRRRHSWSAIYTLILHLAVADLLVTVFCIGGEAIWSYTVEWIWGNIACKLFKYLQMFSLYMSTFVLVLIGADRFIAVRYPMKGLNTSNRCCRLIIVAWILSFILAFPQLVIFHVAKGPFIEEFTQCVTHGFYTKPWQEQLYVSFSLFFMFVLPLSILITTYVSTVITISRSEKIFRVKSTNNNICYANEDINRRKLMHRAKAKSLRLSVVIVAAFIIWWTPYYAMMIILMFLNPNKHLSEELQSGIFFFGMSNSLVNPLIYGAFHLWSRRNRQNSYHRDLSTTQRRLTPTINNDSTYKRESRESRVPFLLKNHSNTTI